MLKLIRLLVLGLMMVLWFLLGLAICLLRPRHRTNVYWLSNRLLRFALPVIGLKVHLKIPPGIDKLGPAVYVANHQTNWDIVVLTCAVQPGVVAVGKKSLVWLPLFGILFYLSGNILIDRSNRARAIDTIRQVVDKIRERRLSIWMFPEGTRSRGRGLLPFKTGAFHTAMQAGVPIVPIVASSYATQVDLNRWDNGEVWIEMLAPVDSQQWARDQVRECSEVIREQMVSKLAELDQQARRPT
ncbi:1-acylglycerol-3-phosphate O-acyltransferase [Pseudaeromonas sharmana]|uniref:1-acyl-sn-glycerol-3-phosphate acyltransferase n=1 Tax=Pseudaeromonas sharmana TaxID=328412 RepID=A0ABV8CMX3_9GAMM